MTGCICPFLPLSHRPSPSPTGSAIPQESVQRLQNGGAFRSGSHSMIFKPPSLLPPRSFPPLASTLDAGAAVAFTSEQNAVRYLPAHRQVATPPWPLSPAFPACQRTPVRGTLHCCVKHGTKAPFPSTATLSADDAGHASPSTQLTRTHLQSPLVARQTLPLTLCS